MEGYLPSPGEAKRGKKIGPDSAPIPEADALERRAEGKRDSGSERNLTATGDTGLEESLQDRDGKGRARRGESFSSDGIKRKENPLNTTR